MDENAQNTQAAQDNTAAVTQTAQPAQNQTEASGVASDNKGAAETAAAGVKSYDTLLTAKAEDKATTDNTKANEDAKAAETVVYDLKGSIPEGWEFSEEEANKFVGVIKDMKLSNEQANAIAKYGFEYASSIKAAYEKELDEMVAGWGTTAKTELGADFDATIAKAGSALEAVEKVIPNVRQALNETGAGNRVELIRALAYFGERIAGDPGKAANVGGAVNKAANEYARYPNTDWSKL